MARQFLEYTDDLTAAPQMWTVIHTNEPPTLVVTNFIDTGAAVPVRFYRVRTAR